MQFSDSSIFAQTFNGGFQLYLAAVNLNTGLFNQRFGNILGGYGTEHFAVVTQAYFQLHNNFFYLSCQNNSFIFLLCSAMGRGSLILLGLIQIGCIGFLGQFARQQKR